MLYLPPIHLPEKPKGKDEIKIAVLDENNQTTLSQVIAGIYQAMEWDCNILNMSFGTEVDSELLHQAVRDAYDSGMLLIAAAGNQEKGKVEYPAAYHEVVAVSATDTTGNKAENTSDGKEIEIFAPGTQIMTTGLVGGTMVSEGTSMSTAQVSGGAALLWSMDKNKDAGFIRSLLVNTTQVVEEKGKSDAGLMDIENAVKQYKKLEKVYQPQVLEYEQIQSNSTAEEYKGVKLVSGSWSKEGHQDMVKNAANQFNIKNDHVRLMQEAARRADYDYQYVSKLHATGNYVQTLKFLYMCADYIRSGVSVEKSIMKASQEAKLKEGNTKKAKIDNDLREAVKKFLLKDNILSGVGEKSKEAQYYKLMGFAMHLTGDTYAHRTIVPKYTVKGTNSKKKIESKTRTSANAKFGTENFKEQSSHKMESDTILKSWAGHSHENKDKICKRWNCFQKTVNLGVMEFKDIKNYTTNGSHKAYEDNANFCMERYADAKLSCEILFEDFYQRREYDGVGIFFPIENNVKLNNLKNYSKEAEQDLSLLTSTEWKKVSTPDFY